MVPAAIKVKYIIRFTVTSQYTTETDLDRDWKIISDTYSKILRDSGNDVNPIYVVIGFIRPVFDWLFIYRGTISLICSIN